MGSKWYEAISAELRSLNYAKVDDVAVLVLQMGVGKLLSKIDLKSVYRVELIRPVDRPLLSIQWKGEIFNEGALHSVCDWPPRFLIP